MSLLQRTETEVLVVENRKRIESFEDDLLQNDQIKQIIVMDDEVCDKHSKLRSIPWILKTISEKDLRERPTIDPESIASFIMTSGTTGDPKIAMLSHVNHLSASKGNVYRAEKANLQSVTARHFSVLPMAHIYEQFIILGVLIRGRQTIFCPSPEKMVHYLSIGKPTFLILVPRILNKVHDMIMTEVNKSKLKQYLIRQALKREEAWWLSRLVFPKVKKLFGGEVKAIFLGSAAIAPEIRHFFRIALDAPIFLGYGQTESTACATLSHASDTSCDTVGSPVATVELKLIDVPGTNYRSDQNQGEICIRGPVVFKGYYKDEEKTRETVDKDGWLRTGDVGEWASEGALRIIDRTKHIFKLSQGVYVAPERLENIYLRSHWIAQIFVDAMSTQSTVVAIVVPNEEYIREHLGLKDPSKSFSDICKDATLKETILNDLIRLGKENKLKYFEIVSNIHIHSDAFTYENGLLTMTLKTRRTNARKQFQEIIQSLYKMDKTMNK